MKTPSQELIKKLLSYEPSTGIFVWNKRSSANKTWNTRYSGKVAGTLGLSGYITIRIGRKPFKAHRLAWIYMVGSNSVVDIDHINMNRSDNRWVNLREATRSQNKANEMLRSTNTSGFRGVSKSKNKWAASIWMNGKQRVIGRYLTKEEAAKAYDVMALHIHGKYARINFSTDRLSSARVA